MAGKHHPQPIRRAAEILLRQTALSTAQIANELGLPRSTIQNWNDRLGQPRAAREAAPMQAASSDGELPDRASLETALHRQIARQIAALDARLDGASHGIDSARMLRDLGGLKRLLDDCSVPVESRAERKGEAGEVELFRMRAEIARRYAAFAGRDTEPVGA